MVDDSRIDLDEHEDIIDDVISERYSESVKWTPGSMKAAIEQVARGRSRTKAAEDYEFSNAILGEVVNEVHEVIDAAEERAEAEIGVSPDPVAEAADDIEEYLEYLNDKFKLGIKEKFINVARREVEMKEQLPHPGTLGDMIAQYDSGIGRDSGDIGFIVNDYASWLQKYQDADGDWRAHAQTSGVNIQHGNQQGGGSGVPVGQPATPPGAHGHASGGQQPGAPAWAQQLQHEIDRVASALETDDRGGSTAGGQGMIRVERRVEDGEDEVWHVPPDSPYAQEFLGNDDGESFLEQLAAAKEAGLIVTPDQLDSGESEVAAAVQAGLEQVGEAQKESASQFRDAVRSVTQSLAAESEGEDLTPEKVDEIITERLTKSEQDRLREEVEALRDEVARQSNDTLIMPSEGGAPLMQDREVMTRYVDRQAEADQLKTVEHAGDKLIDKGVPELRKGLREIGLILSQGGHPMGAPSGMGDDEFADVYTPPSDRGEPSSEPEPADTEPAEPEPQGRESAAATSGDVEELWAAYTEGDS